MQKSDGMNYAPVAQGKVEVVCKPGEFVFAVLGLDHGHIFAICNGLLEAGATLTRVWDSDPTKVLDFVFRYPQAMPAEDQTEILNDPAIQMVASATRPFRRCALGISVMEHGKDFFVDKPGMLTYAEIASVQEVCTRTGRKYVVYFGERIHVEGAVYAQELIRSGAIGRVLQITILAPHRLNRPARPDWFFEPKENGGIIGEHRAAKYLSSGWYAKQATLL